MKLIKLTSINKQQPIYINIDMIGHLLGREDVEYNIVTKYTNIGVVTHNNGGFNVIESVEEILKLIKE